MTLYNHFQMLFQAESNSIFKNCNLLAKGFERCVSEVVLKQLFRCITVRRCCAQALLKACDDDITRAINQWFGVKVQDNENTQETEQQHKCRFHGVQGAVRELFEVVSPCVPVLLPCVPVLVFD